MSGGGCRPWYAWRYSWPDRSSRCPKSARYIMLGWMPAMARAGLCQGEPGPSDCRVKHRRHSSHVTSAHAVPFGLEDRPGAVRDVSDDRQTPAVACR